MEHEVRSMKEWRILLVMSLQELSQRTGISTQSLAILENNQHSFVNSNAVVISEIAKALGIKPENFRELCPNKLGKVDTYE
ncbi:helix-turn-helix domain-containing protein [Nosocomiicoccus ampullae]|uniref:helix-turn-helix domain-containing protein n=1 Tax=Nosocomiicoccus ampullae TaxID=489910 RepID=UPI001C6060F1|nr:helix-turn-helix transcriptional regulator [Nosocomiicoccus ampullae]QYA48011.1 helix-turn-helix domain-containing protein [Nosocomiicoccus ampullae]